MKCDKCGYSEQVEENGNPYPFVCYDKDPFNAPKKRELNDVYALCGKCQIPLAALLTQTIADFIQPERSKREDALLKEPCGTCLACRWYPCFRNEE